MFKKVDSFTTEYQLSRIHSVSVCVDGVSSAMIRIKSIYEFMKNENKLFR